MAARPAGGFPARAARAGKRLLAASPAVPDLVWTIAFFGAPVLLLLAFSFGRTDPVTLQTDFGFSLESYERIVDPFILKAIGRSLLMSLGATLACAVIALPMAIWMVRQSPTVQRVLLVAVIVPFWISQIARILAWDTLLSGGGPIDDIFSVFGASFNLYATPVGVSIVIVYQYLPLMILPVYVAIERIDRDLLAAASDLGARQWRVLLRVTMPLARSGIAAGSAVVGILALGEYVIPEVIGGGKTIMLGNLIANQFNSGQLGFGSALTMSLIALLFTIVALQQLVGRDHEVRFER